jgi:hypothetical protein
MAARDIVRGVLLITLFIAATYRLPVRDGRHWPRVNSRRWEALEATRHE